MPEISIIKTKFKQNIQQLIKNSLFLIQIVNMERKQRSAWRKKLQGSISKVAKAYFHKIQPECQQYLKAKEANIKISKKLRQGKSAGKENINSGFMFQFVKPKLGYYALKGCNLNNLRNTMVEKDYKTESRQIKQVQNEAIKGKSQFLHCFLNKNFNKKQKSTKKQQSQILLPVLKQNYHSLQSKELLQVCSQSSFSKIGSSKNFIFSTEPMVDKMKTQPVIQKMHNKPKNTSLKYIQKR